MYKRMIVLAASAVTALCLVGAAQSSTPQVLSGKQYGKTYPQWSAAWWQWALAIPVHAPPRSGPVNHPLVDLTGAKCGVGQSGPVWFLGAAFIQTGQPFPSAIVRDHCTVPKSKALFFPLLNTECTAVELPAFCGPPDQTVEGARVFIDSVIDLVVNLAADVDGVPIPISSQFRVGSTNPSFCVTLPPDDVLTFIGEGPFSPGPSCDTVDDGYYLMLAPLPPGAHTLHFHGEIPDFGLTLDVTYNLTVS
jgi:hypothetical protein